MKFRTATALITAAAASTMLAACSSGTAESLGSSCEELATERLDGNWPDSKIESQTASAVQRDEDEVQAFDIAGTTSVTTDGDLTEWQWTCFGQQVDGKQSAAIQRIYRS